jgi:hypothetical protein
MRDGVARAKGYVCGSALTVTGAKLRKIDAKKSPQKSPTGVGKGKKPLRRRAS